MRKGENDDTKSQISIRGSIHGARSVTSCEKANFMVCFQEAGKRPRRDFVSFFSSPPLVPPAILTLFSCCLLSCSSVFAVWQVAKPKVQMCSVYMHARTPSQPPALEDAQTHTPALTYICWVWWMPMCKFFKRFSGCKLEWALLLAEFLCLGPPRSAPRFAQ